MRRAAYRGGAGDGLRRWIAVSCGLILAAVVITFAVLGPLSHTSRRDVRFATVAPVARSGRAAGRAGRTPGQPAATPAAAAKRTPQGTRAPDSPAAAHLRAAMTRAMTLAGPDSGALVYDLGTRSVLYALRAGVKRPPASLEKLWTTAALMSRLGPGARLHTAVLGTGSLRNGVWHGDLYLRGGGDPTFGDPTFNRVWELGYGPTAGQLVAQLVGRGIHRVTGSVIADESMFDRRRGGLLTNYGPDVPDFGGQLSALTYDHGSSVNHVSPAAFAARELVLTMRGSQIRATAAKRAAQSPRQARLLAIVDSPPMAVMARLMDVPSDDLFAELLTKQLGVLFGTGGTISAGAQVITRTIAGAYDLHPKVLDGSGLSRQDSSSPLEVVDLLRDVWHTAVGRELSASLPTVGVDGTVRSIGLKTAAQGHCIAKTGTLDNITNLAGYCGSRGHHVLAFALFIDGPPNYSAVVLESRMIAAIARY